MYRKMFLPILLLATLLMSMKAQRRNEPVEVTVGGMEATPYGVSVTLRASQSRDAIRMMIGISEGEAIARALRHQRTPRPMTHDLLKAFLDRNGWRVQKVLIRDLAGGTFLADVTLERNGETQVYDARPSDAMAIGLRYDAKIYVNREVFELQRKGEEGEKELKPSEPDTLRL